MQTRKTFQKTLTFDAVTALKNHPTADEIYSYIVKQYPEISRATVYRNLNYLCDIGDVYRVKISGAADHFDHNATPHYHFRCSICGDVTDINLPYMENINSACAGASGNQVTAHQIFFEGKCKNCTGKVSKTALAE